MPDNLLNILKIFLVILVWLFFIRVMRAVWVESRRPAAAGPDTPSGIGGGFGAGTAARSPAGRSSSAATSSPSGAATGSSEKKTVFLTVTEPAELEGDVYELDGEESVIGRASGCAVSIEADTFISHLHARIFTRGAELWIEDLGSTNGTYVNSKRLTSPVPLRMGDTVHVGHTAFEVSR